MGGYIGARAGSLSTTTVANVQDVTATDTTPEVTIINNTHEDTDGGREGKVIFKGQQSGGEESTLAEIQGSHDGTSDDEKGDLIFKTNDGSDGTSPTERMRIDSDGVVTITRADNGTQLNLKSTDADGSGGPILDLTRDSASPADGDVLGLVRFKGDDAGGNETTYAQMIGFIEDEAAGAEDGTFKIETLIGGSSQARLDMTSTETVFNEGSIDLDFRVESNGSANAFFVEGDDNGGANDVAIGINTNAPEQHSSLSGDGPVLHISGDDSQIRMDNNIIHSDNSGNTKLSIRTGYGGTNSGAQLALEGGHITLHSGTSFTQRAIMNANGQFLIGTNSWVDSGTKQGLSVKGGGGGPYVLLVRNDDTGGGAALVKFSDGSDDILGTIVGNATSNTTTYGTSSDYRLKENVTDVSNAITTVKTLKPKTYNFISDPDNTPEDGFLAHELAAIVPNAVTGEKDAMTEAVLYVEGDEIPDGKKVGDVKIESKINPQQVDYGKLTPILTAALQEAIAKIETLETKVAALEG